VAGDQRRRELGTTRAVPADSRFRIGSITKTFVATVVLQLVGEGRLRLDETVEAWLPGVVRDGRRITVRHLLNHTSGLYDTWMMKRAVAVPGDPVPPSLAATVSTAAGTPVPEGRLLVLGDNTARSADSRQHGYLSADRVLGVVVRRIGHRTKEAKAT
jgi:CubicO group peptidase (beta-lactamase class C family)